VKSYNSDDTLNVGKVGFAGISLLKTTEKRLPKVVFLYYNVYMKNRLLKQFLYGIFYLIILGLIGYGGYNIASPAPSCFDNKLNGLEENIDCGGSCIACSIKNLSDIKVVEALVLDSGNQKSSIVLRIENPNSTYGVVNFKYSIKDPSNDKNIIENESFIYPSEIKYIIHPAIDKFISDQISVVVNREKLWESRNNFSLPKVGTIQVTHSTDGQFIKTNGLVSNNETNPFPEIIINALYYNEVNTIIGASRTIIFDVLSFEQRRFDITHPDVGADLSKTRIFIEAKRPNIQGILY